MPRPSVYMSFSSNIAKVESRGKIYFDYAETKRIYELQLKYSKSREQSENLFEFFGGRQVFLSCSEQHPDIHHKANMAEPMTGAKFISMILKRCAFVMNHGV